MRAPIALVWAFVPVLLAACASHPPEPLDPAAVLASIEQRRDAASDAIADLATAEARLAEYSPRLVELRVALAAAERLAGIETPLPNPELSAELGYLSGVRGAGSDRFPTEVGLDWSVWLDDRRAQQDALRLARAELARAALVEAETDERLALRREWWALCDAEQALAVAREQERLASRALELARERVEAGLATGLELRELELDLIRTRGELGNRRETALDARAAVAARLSVAPDRPAPEASPVVPSIGRDVTELRAALPTAPALRRLEQDYRVAELELALEVSRQNPGLGFGLLKERDGGESRWALGPSIELPLFDRNQLGIAEALGRREVARARYEAALAASVAELDRALGSLGVRNDRLELLRDGAAPLAAEVVELARRAVEDGVGSSLRYLDALRQERAVLLELADARAGARDAYAAVEAALGRPPVETPSAAASTAAGRSTPAEETSR